MVPLDVPHSIDELPGELQRHDAVKLFLESVKGSYHENEEPFTLTKDNNARYVAAICRLLDGLPLALLMAGSWVKTLTIKGVYTRRLRVFRGKCSIEAAAEVCNLGDLPTDKTELENMLANLSRHHFITFDGGYVQITHNILRDYVMRKLLKGRDDWDEWDQRFIAYCDRFLREFHVTRKETKDSHKERGTHVTGLSKDYYAQELNIDEAYNSMATINAMYIEEKLRRIYAVIFGEETNEALLKGEITLEDDDGFDVYSYLVALRFHIKRFIEKWDRNIPYPHVLTPNYIFYDRRKGERN